MKWLFYKIVMEKNNIGYEVKDKWKSEGFKVILEIGVNTLTWEGADFIIRW